jgi:hypothetical protein
MTTAQMQTQANFTSATAANGHLNPGWDFGGTWLMYSGSTYPLLKSFLKPIVVTANNTSAVYTSAVWNGSDTYTCSTGNCSGLMGSITYGGTAAGAIHVGQYSILPSGLYSNQQGYAITYMPGQLTITPATLTITGLTASSKVYDATTAAVLSGTATVTPLGSDKVVLSGTGVGVFDSRNVGTGKAVTVTGYTISGAAAGNYTLVEPTGLTANITPANLLLSGITANNKVYDATVAATLSGTATVTPLGNDRVAVSGTGVGAFTNKNAGANKAVTVSGYTLTGADAGNYTLVEPTGLSANINPANLTVGGVTAANKVYDGTVAATLGGTAFVSPLGNDAVILTGTGSGTFTDKNVGANKAVNVSGYALNGADAANYTLVEPTNVTASITARPLTISATGINKVYDGTTTAPVTMIDNRVAGDGLTVGYTSAAFADANVGTGKAISVSGISLTGPDAGNYTFNPSATTIASITAAPLTIAANSANKPYDGSAYYGGNGVTFAGFVAGETPSVLGGSLTYGGSSQGAINVGTYTIIPGGLRSSNYAITFVDSTLTIAPAPLATATTQASKLIAATLYGGLTRAQAASPAAGYPTRSAR